MYVLRKRLQVILLAAFNIATILKAAFNQNVLEQVVAHRLPPPLCPAPIPLANNGLQAPSVGISFRACTWN